MGWPSDLLRDYKLQQAATRREALEKARAVRSAQAQARREAEAQKPVHLHPADDHYTIKCRTLCEKVVKVEEAVAPAAAHRSATFAARGCPRCRERLLCWYIIGNGKPLTLRRLRGMMDKVAGAWRDLWQRAAVACTEGDSSEALALRLGFGDFGMRGAMADLFMTLSMHYLDGKPEQRSALLAELHRMQHDFPPEVWAALRG